jgi:sugar phosphate isomerase/epimerase
MPAVPRVAVQLYGLREPCTRDLAGTLAALRRTGFTAVEVAGLHDREPAELRGLLDGAGLEACSLHVALADLAGREAAWVEVASALGCALLVVPWAPPTTTEDEARATVAAIAAAGARVRELGARLGYHNHDHDVLPPAHGGDPLLRRLAALDPADLFFELDLGWVWYAALDPADLLREHAGRAPLVHVKDFATRSGWSYRALGEGSVPYAALLPLLDDADWLILEQDDVEPGDDPLAAAARSLDALRGLRDAG